MIEIAPAELGPVIGHDAGSATWLAAAASGRMHHGWLLRGPRGVGKARLALQFAAHLLGADPGNALAVNAETPIGHLIIARQPSGSARDPSAGRRQGQAEIRNPGR